MIFPNVEGKTPTPQVRMALVREFASLTRLMQSEVEDPLLDQVCVDLAEALAVSLARIAARLGTVKPQQRCESPLGLPDHQVHNSMPLTGGPVASVRHDKQGDEPMKAAQRPTGPA